MGVLPQLPWNSRLVFPLNFPTAISKSMIFIKEDDCRLWEQPPSVSLDSLTVTQHPQRLRHSSIHFQCLVMICN